MPKPIFLVHSAVIYCIPTLSQTLISILGIHQYTKQKIPNTHGNYLIAGRGRVGKQSINNKHNNKVNTECVRRLLVMRRKEKVDKASERQSIDYIVH